MKIKPATSKRGASKFSSPKAKTLTGIPGWIWLLAGLAVGFFGATLSGLTPQGVRMTTPDNTTTNKQSSQLEKNNQPVFNFYTSLPEVEIITPLKKLPSNTVKQISSGYSTETNTSNEITDKTSSIKHQAQFLLQAGAFKSVHDAKRLKAKLLQQGLKPKIQTVAVGGGETWHRVQLGPFDNSSSLNEVRTILASQNIDSLILQLK